MLSLILLKQTDYVLWYSSNGLTFVPNYQRLYLSQRACISDSYLWACILPKDILMRCYIEEKKVLLEPFEANFIHFVQHVKRVKEVIFYTHYFLLSLHRKSSSKKRCGRNHHNCALSNNTHVHSRGVHIDKFELVCETTQRARDKYSAANEESYDFWTQVLLHVSWE